MGLTSTFTHLDSTSFYVDGRYNSAEAPDEQVVHITHGYSRDHRPDLNQVMLELVVEHQAGIPVLMKPLSGTRSDGKAFGQVVSDHIAQLHTTAHPTYLVADRALYSAENLHKLAETSLKWITRVPATLTEAQEVLAQAQPETMPPPGRRLSLCGLRLELRRCGATLSSHLLGTSPAAGPAHGRYAVAQAE